MASSILSDADFHQYMDSLSDTLGRPRVHHHFKSVKLDSGKIRLNLEVLEHHPDAPTLIFLPGTAIYAMCYSETLYQLAQGGYNIIGVDPRGHGRSTGKRGDYTIAEMMQDTGKVIDYAIERFNSRVSLMGCSQGGIVAFYMAARDQRLHSVVCQNIADLTAPETVMLAKRPRLFKYLKLVFTKAGKLIPNAQIPISGYIDLDKIPVRHFGTARKFMEMDPLVLKKVSLRALKSLANTPMDQSIENINVPVMVVQGGADSIFPVAYTQKLFDELKTRKRMLVYEGKSHALMHEEEGEVVRDILQWLNEIHAGQ